MENQRLSGPEKWLLWGIPALWAAGALLHFAYEFTGGCPAVALFAPVNESVWEHGKMVVLPLLLWWGAFYLVRGGAEELDPDAWFAGLLAALVTAVAAMPLLFYFYTQAFGVELLWVDVLILLAALAAGQLLGLHVYRHGGRFDCRLTLLALVVVVLAFVAFTFSPPALPLFKDGVTGMYGIPPKSG